MFVQNIFCEVRLDYRNFEVWHMFVFLNVISALNGTFVDLIL